MATLTLQEMAFADLMALGWSNPSDVYKALNVIVCKNMSEAKIKGDAKVMAGRQDIRDRIVETKKRIEARTERTTTSSEGGELDFFSKESVLKNLREEYDSAIDGKQRVAVLDKISVIQGHKKEESIGDDDPVKIYAPARCEGCSLFKEALDSGKIKRDFMDKV